MPAVSIIIPCYNVSEKLITRCIDSIISQEFSDIEVLMIDDGSKPEFKEGLKKAASLDSRIILFEKENGGVSSARNFGTEKAEGEYIVFADADDVLYPDFISEGYKIISDNNADFVIGGNVNLKYYDEPRDSLDIKIYEEDDIKKIKPFMFGNLKKFGEHHGYFGRGPWTRLVRSEIAKSTPFDTGLAVGEDIVWNLEILEKSHKVCMAERVWYGYYTSGSSATRGFNPNVIIYAERELNAIRKHININSDAEYKAFCQRITEDLKRISDCYIYADGNKLSSKERSEIIKKLYSETPWNQLCEKRFKNLVSGKALFINYLYRLKLVFAYWSMKSKIKSLKKR